MDLSRLSGISGRLRGSGVLFGALAALAALLLMGDLAFLSENAIRLSEVALWSNLVGACGLIVAAVHLSFRAYRRVRRNADRISLAVAGAADGMWEWDVRRDGVFYDHQWKAMLGYPDKAIGNRLADWLERVHPEDLPKLREQLDAHLAGATERFERQYRIRDALGGWRWMLARGVAQRDLTGQVRRVAGLQMDIGEWKREEARLQHDALHDPLTGLPNRALFLDRLGRVSERGRRRSGYRYAVLFLDLDRFKVVNDGLGHAVGDELLKVVARRLLLCVRQEDTVARLGGDEFGILLSEAAGLDDATRIAERVNASLLQPVRIGEHEVFTSVSIGVAHSPAGFSRPEDVIRDADSAMYRAKAAGGMRYEVEGGVLHTEAVRRLRLETELRRSADRGELRIQYQPIMELPTSRPQAARLSGLEALLRWQHPQRGLLMPEDFLSLAEETGIVLVLDWWVIGRVCEHVARWGDALLDQSTGQPIKVSINISGKHFWHEDFIARLDRVLAATGARAENLKFEVTETAVMRDAEAATRVLAEIRRRGIGLAIDDFGTGYSSLTYLQRFPVDAVKIDRSFVGGMTEGSRNTELIRSILALARALDLDAVAEGVETLEELQELSRLGCGLAQGYLFSHPLDPEAAGDLLAGRSATRLEVGGSWRRRSPFAELQPDARAGDD